MSSCCRYLRFGFGLSYRDVEELLTDRCVEADHVTIYRWVQRFIPPLADAARPSRHAVGAQWWVGILRITPVEVVTDHAPVYPGVLEELAPAA